MKYSILFVLLFPAISNAQPGVAGLGQYRMGITTPDSLPATGFEEEQAYVKGTIALTCTPIRVIHASTVEITGFVITNLSLFFYDNKLFKLSCDYREELTAAFLAKHGEGSPTPKVSFSLCASRNDKSTTIWGEAWQNGDMSALAIHAEGYDADCEKIIIARLTIASRRFTALASDCDLKSVYSFSEEFVGLLNNYEEKQWNWNK